MSFIQRLIKAVLPPGWSAAIEAESRRWVKQCPCGREVSVWDAGGVRFLAAGNPRKRARCPACGITWHRLYKRPAQTGTPS